MSVEDHTANDCCKKSSREGCAGAVVGSLHEEVSDSNQMNHDNSNREGGKRKENPGSAQCARAKHMANSAVGVGHRPIPRSSESGYPAT